MKAFASMKILESKINRTEKRLNEAMARISKKQILKDNIRKQFEEYVVQTCGDYAFDPYGWEPDIVTASDSLLDAGFEWPECSPGSALSVEYWEMIEHTIAEIDLDDIKQEVMEAV